MKKRTVLLGILCCMFFTACSMKVQTKYYKKDIVEYNDEILDFNLMFRKKGKYCLKKAHLKNSEIILKINLNKNCEVVSGKYYDIFDEFIANLPEDKKELLTQRIRKYILQREEINTQLFNKEEKTSLPNK